MAKRILTMTVVSMFLFTTTIGSTVSAAENPQGDSDRQEVIDNAIEELEDEGTTTNMDVSESVKSKMDKILSTKDEDFSNEIKMLKRSGFDFEEEVSDYVTFEDLKDGDKTYKNVGIATEFFVKNNKEIAKKMAWINLETDEVIRYDLDKIQEDASGEVNATSIAEYDVNTVESTDSGEVSTYDFNFNGVSFACSVSGIIACTSAFGGLTVFFPAVGGALSLGCQLAFSAGCATDIT